MTFWTFLDRNLLGVGAAFFLFIFVIATLLGAALDRRPSPAPAPCTCSGGPTP